MNIIKFIFQVLLHLLKIVIYQWIFDAIDIVKRFLKTLKRFWNFQKLPHPVREEADDCTIIDNPAMHRPDPCIYSQLYLLKLGLPVTWDNPDIVITKSGVPVPEHELLPDTEYEIDATIWNNSYEAPVVGLKVMFSYLSFGIATGENLIGTTFVNLGVKGGVNHPALAKMLWKTPPQPGHYCVKVALEWFDDLNRDNNIGQNNLDVVSPQSPAEFRFRLKNNTGKPNRFTFEVDTYALPELEECPATIPAEDKGTRAECLRQIRSIHNRANFPVPPGWTVELIPAEISLLENQETEITVKIDPPDNFSGTKPFNVNAIYGENYAGGVSLVVSKT